MKSSLVVLAVVLTAACAAESPAARTPTPVTPTIAAWSPPTVNLTALTTGSDPAVLSVMATSDGGRFIREFPTSVGSRACVIFGPGGFLIPAVCRTEVEKRRSDYVVTFTQVWPADWGTGRDTSSGRTSVVQRQHTWSYLIADTGAVIYQGSFGDDSPQEMR